MVKGSIRIFIGDGLMLPAGFVVAVFLTRALGPDDYGRFALVARTILWAQFLCTAGLSKSTVKFVADASNWEAAAASTTRLFMLGGLLVGCLLFIFSPDIARLFHEPDLAYLLRVFSIEVPFFALLVAAKNILVGRAAYVQYSWISGLRWNTRVILVVLFVLLGFGVPGAIAGSVGSVVVAWLVSTRYVSPRLIFHKGIPVARIWKFSLPLILGAFSMRVFRLDLFILKAMGASAAHAGYLATALNLTVPPAIFSYALSQPLLATLSRQIGSGDYAPADIISRMSIRTIFWSLPLAAVVAGASDEIVRLLFGAAFTPAGNALGILIFSAVGFHAINITTAFLTAHGRPGLVLIQTAPLTILALLAYMVFIPRWGYAGAGGATTLVALVGGAIGMGMIYRLSGLRPPLRTVLTCTGCAAVVFFVSLTWQCQGAWVLVKLLVLSLAVFVSLVLMREFSRSELVFLQSLFRSLEGARAGQKG